MSSSPYSSSTNVSDEDNHPEHHHRYERDPEARRPKRRQRSRNIDEDYILPMWVTGTSVHHPVADPDDPKPSRPVDDVEADRLLAEYQARELSNAVVRKDRKAARKARAADKRARHARRR